MASFSVDKRGIDKIAFPSVSICHPLSWTWPSITSYLHSIDSDGTLASQAMGENIADFMSNYLQKKQCENIQNCPPTGWQYHDILMAKFIGGMLNNVTEASQPLKKLVEEVPPGEVDQFEFRGAEFDRGLAFVQFPEGLGGLGLESRKLQTVVDSELRSAGVPYHDLAINPIGIGMGAPVVLTYASDEQKERLLRPMFTGEEIWCQLFSEPGAGSDVAGLSSRAVQDGDEWIVNGQKVWTTLAHVSKWGMLVARTDPDQPKHKGMTYFLLDMESQGVEVRPLHQITGEAEFNEVFFNDVQSKLEPVF